MNLEFWEYNEIFLVVLYREIKNDEILYVKVFFLFGVIFGC